MWRILQNEWRYLLRTKLFFRISLAFILALGAATSLGNWQIQKQRHQSEQAGRHLREQWESIDAMNPHSAAHFGTYVFRPASLMNSLDKGVYGITGNVLRVEGHVQNEIVYSEASQMKMASKFGKLDSSLLLQYIVPLLLIFLAFSSLTDEKTSGRIKLLILHGGRTQQLLFGKALAVWLYGLTLLSVVVLLHVFLNLANLTGDEMLRMLLLFSSYALYYLILCGLTVYLSARLRNPTASLTAMVAIWVVWTVFLPNILLSVVEKNHPLPSRKDFRTAMREDRSQGVDGHNPADERKKVLEQQILEKYGVDSLSQLPINFDGILMQADEEYGNKVWDKHFGHLRTILSRQKNMMQLGGLVNPFISLQNASMGFAGSDNLHHQQFLLQVEDYRRSFIEMLNHKHAYGGSKTGDWGWKADNAFFRSVPDFQYRPVSLSSVFSLYIKDLALLIIWATFTFLLLLSAARKLQII